MSNRRLHTNSHHGCVLCKKRKVRCDETWPSCKNCVKRRTTCEYGHSQNAGVYVPQNGNDQNSALVSQHRSLLVSWTHVQPEQQGSGPIGNVDNLWLMHQYTSQTYLTISEDPSFDYTWRDSMPELAFHHPFLLHGLLSLSAFHLISRGHQSSEAHYRSLGTYHYSTAIASYQESLSGINSSNCHALFAFSVLAPVVAFAITNDRPIDPIQEMLDIVGLLQGVIAVVEPFLQIIKSGPFGIFKNSKFDMQPEALPPEVERIITSLKVRMQSKKLDLNQSSSQDNHAAITVKNLRLLFANLSDRPRSIRLAIWFLVFLDKDVVAALRDRREIALGTFVIYGVALHHIRSFWYTSRSGKALVDAAIPHLGAEWEETVDWATRSVTV